MPDMPANLSSDAQEVWHEVVDAHHAPERIVGPDLDAYCVQVARMRDAQARIDAEGLIVADEKGRPVPHPAVELERRAQTEVRAWGDRFRGRKPRS